MALKNQYADLALDGTLQKLVDRRSAMGSANLISGSQNRLREPWNSIDATKWAVSQSNMTVSATGGNLQIAMGTVANATASITSIMTFTAPARIQVSLAMSQKIANNTIYLELVGRNAANTANDETMLAQWRISGNDITTATNAVYNVQNGAYSTASLVGNTPVISHTGTTPNSIFEIEFKSSEVWFHSRLPDVSTGRAYSYLRNSMSPNPMVQYNFRIRAVNGATAPASATTVYIGMTMIQDYTEINTEITGARGTNAASDALPVNLTNLPPASYFGTNSTASTNASLIKSTPGNIYLITASNTTTTAAYLKIYNTASAPTVGTTLVVMTLPIPASSTQIFNFGPVGFRATTGIASAITGAITSADTTATVAGIFVTYTYS